MARSALFFAFLPALLGPALLGSDRAGAATVPGDGSATRYAGTVTVPGDGSATRYAGTVTVPGDSRAARRDTVYVLPGLSVEERRATLARELSLRPGFAALHVVDSIATGSTTTAELLSQTVGVHVRQLGGLGSYSAVSVRGSNPNQVAYYLDGVPLNQAQYGVLDAADLPLAALERVEVYRGAGPVAFGSPGGGVVNLVTRAVRGTRGAARAGYGRFDSRRAEGWASWAGPRLRAFGAYHYLSSRGDFAFLDDNGTPLNPADDEEAVRRNNAFRSQGLTAKLEAPLGAAGAGGPGGSLGRLVLGADLLVKRAGMPGISAYQSSRARYATDRGIASATWSSPAWLGRALELETQAWGLGTRERFSDPENELGAGPQQTDDRAWSWGARQRLGVAAGPLDHATELLAEAAREEFEPRSLAPAPGAGPPSRRETVTFGVEERLEPWRGRVTLSGSLRRQAVFDHFPRGPSYAGALPQPGVARTLRWTTGGAGLRARLGGGFVLRANAGHAERAPSLFELYGNRGAVVGNRALRPERVESRDAGLAWSGRREGGRGAAALEAEVAVYRADARDLIVFLQNSQHTSVAQNVSAARLEGIEASLSGRAGPLRLAANWTRQAARDRSGVPYWDGRELPGRPADEVFARTAWERGPWRVFHELHYVSANFLDRAGRQPVPARRVHNAGAGVALARGAVRLTVEVLNAGDDRVQDVAGYPLPGRSWFATVEVRP